MSCRSPRRCAFCPSAAPRRFEPYVGAGIGIFNWRYSEAGEFVDFSDGTIFRDRVQGRRHRRSGRWCSAALRFPIGDAMTAGVEFRWQKAEGDTKPAESRLLAPKIDLGGWTTS